MKLIEFDSKIENWIKKHRGTYWLLIIGVCFSLSFLFSLLLGRIDGEFIFEMGVLYSAILLIVDYTRGND